MMRCFTTIIFFSFKVKACLCAFLVQLMPDLNIDEKNCSLILCMSIFRELKSSALPCPMPVPALRTVKDHQDPLDHL